MNYSLKDYSGGHKGFYAWLQEVEAILVEELGIGILDLADQCWRDKYDDEVPADEAAAEVLDNPYDFI